MSTAIPAMLSNATATVPSPSVAGSGGSSTTDSGFGAVLADAVEVAQSATATAAAMGGNASPPGSASSDAEAPGDDDAIDADAAEVAVDSAADGAASTTIAALAEALELPAETALSAVPVTETVMPPPVVDDAVANVPQQTAEPLASTDTTASHAASEVAAADSGGESIAAYLAPSLGSADQAAAGSELGQGRSGVDFSQPVEMRAASAQPLQRPAVALPAEAGEAVVDNVSQGVGQSVDADAAELAEVGDQPDLRPVPVQEARLDDSSNRANAAASTPAIDQRAETGRSTGAALLDLLADNVAANPADRMAAQIGWMTRNGSQFARLQVHPEELGPIDISIEQRDGGLAVTMTASHAATRALLEQHVDRMRELLAQDGNTTTRFDVTADNSRGQQRDAATDERSGGQGGLPNGRDETDEAPMAPPIRLSGHLPSLLDAYA